MPELCPDYPITLCQDLRVLTWRLNLLSLCGAAALCGCWLVLAAQAFLVAEVNLGVRARQVTNERQAFCGAGPHLWELLDLSRCF